MEAIEKLDTLLNERREGLDLAIQSDFYLKLGQWNFESADICKTTLT